MAGKSESKNAEVPAATTRSLLIALMGSNVFALIVGGIYEYLSLRGIINMNAAWAVLVFVWLLGVVGIVISEFVWGKGIKHRIWWGIGASIILGLILLAFDRVVSAMVRAQVPVALSSVIDNPVDPATSPTSLSHLPVPKPMMKRPPERYPLISAAQPSMPVSSSPQPQQQTISAPNGIAIGGGTVTNPTVNNYAPPQRQFTKEEREKFISYLRPFCPFEIVVRPIPGNAESMQYSDQIANAIKDAGCTLGRTPFLIDNAASYGIYISIHDINDIPPGADALAGAFGAAGIPFKSVPGDPVKPKAVYVMVNLNDSKPQ